MKLIPPTYFEETRQKSESRWRQLEGDPELAAPWYQLFKQVQSPRHVISELLQNADDAEATDVSISINEGSFTFDHNGHDFSADEFASLCRFGYSNKRLLHTIGFRGIGFKSTFSLGETVGLRTPSLLVAFHKKRFTLPIWLDGEKTRDTNTRIFVKLTDEDRRKELLNNMDEWLNSPFSLLFFNHVRRVKLGDKELHWTSLGEGPIQNSEWMSLQGHESPYLVVRSADEAFPEEAIKEIREERLLDLTETNELPPCKVEIVLGAPGHLFVVLPTGVKTSLPFAMNAPFIQDPARLKIKDPEISFTNRWLLDRIGKLASQAMLQWLGRADFGQADRARGYDFLPFPSKKESSLESGCTSVVIESVVKAAKGRAFILTNIGTLEMAGQCKSVPPVVWDIWSGDEIISIIRSKLTSPVLLSNAITLLNQEKLQKHGLVPAIENDAFLNALVEKRPPQPKNWSALLLLWRLANSYYFRIKELNIHPVRGKNELYSAKKVVRLGEKKLLQSEDDWDFLAEHLLVLDVNWLRYLTDQRRVALDTSNKLLAENIEAADRVLHKCELYESSNLDNIIEQVAKDFFSQSQINLQSCVHFTQIAAKLNAKIGASFRFCARDKILRFATDPIIFDESGKLEELIPPSKREHLILHELYTQEYIACTKEEWLNWVQAGNSALKTFIPISVIGKRYVGQISIEEEVSKRDFIGSLEFKYKSTEFQLDDWDFPQEYWNYWQHSALENPMVWINLVQRLLREPKSWEYARSAKAFHLALNGTSKLITPGNLTPGWVLKLRELPCLSDTRGQYRKPSELMRRTPQTEPLMDVEAFMDARLDFEAARPLLDLLGVRTIPTGPRQILERIRALAQADKPPLLELTKWYQRLDAMYGDCSSVDQQEIRAAFLNERLIFCEDGSWQTSETVFITVNESDIPDVALIHSMASQLSIWAKVGVRDRPTLELTIDWLNSLPYKVKLPPADIRRIKALLGRYPSHIWQVCGSWLNLAGEWVPGDTLHFSLTMQSLIRWTNFHDWVKAQTADLQMLNVEMIREVPFSGWPSLASQVEKRTEKPIKPGRRVDLTWLQAVGRNLSRISLDDEIQTERIRRLAARLALSVGQRVESINVMPYLNGEPAGLPEEEKLVWLDEIVYITDIPKARLIRQITEAFASVFEWPELKIILAYGFERSEEDIRAYLEENYSLSSIEEIESSQAAIHGSASETPGSFFQGKVVPAIGSGSESEADEDGEEPPIEGIDDHPAVRPTHKPGQIKIPLIERFALGQGFQKLGAHVYSHSNGNTLSKSDGVFPWQIQEPVGTIVNCYWAKEHCLFDKPLELPMEVWHLIEQYPNLHSLILEDWEGNPIEMAGSELFKLKQSGTLKLYPATYRLTLELQGE